VSELMGVEVCLAVEEGACPAVEEGAECFQSGTLA
jgi:hypothetical protein